MADRCQFLLKRNFQTSINKLRNIQTNFLFTINPTRTMDYSVHKQMLTLKRAKRRQFGSTTTGWHGLKQAAVFLSLDSKWPRKKPKKRTEKSAIVSCRNCGIQSGWEWWMNYYGSEGDVKTANVQVWTGVFTGSNMYSYLGSSLHLVLLRCMRLTVSPLTVCVSCRSTDQLWCRLTDSICRHVTYASLCLTFFFIKWRIPTVRFACRAWASPVLPTKPHCYPTSYPCMSSLSLSVTVGDCEGGFQGIFHRY